MDYIEFELPVGAKIEERGESRTVGTMVKTRIPVVSEDDAPLVAHWNGYSDHGEHQFRAWNGGLVVCEVGGAQDGPETLKTAWDMPTLRSRARLLNNPYFCWGGGIASETDGALTASAKAHPALERNVRLALERMEGSVIADGRVWVPTTGPRISLCKVNDGIINIFAGGPCYVGAFRDPRRTYLAPWSAVDIGSIKEALETTRGIGGCRDLSPRFDVFSWDGWSRAAIEQDSDRMVLDYLIEGIVGWRQGTRLSKASPEMIEALAAVRDARRNVANERQAEPQDDDFADRFAAVTRWFDLARERWGGTKDATTDLALFGLDIDRIASRNSALFQSLEGFSI